MKQQQYWVGTQKVKQETEAITRVDDYSILLTFVTVTCHSVDVHCARRLDWSRSKFPPWWLQYDESINLIWSRVLFWSKLRVFKWRHWVPAKRQNKEKKNSPIWKIPFHTTPGIYLCDAGRVCCSIVGIYQSSVEKVVDHLVIGVEYGNDAIISFKIMISPPQSLNACRNVICCKPTWNCEILLFLLVAADTFLVFFIG